MCSAQPTAEASSNEKVMAHPTLSRIKVMIFHFLRCEIGFDNRWSPMVSSQLLLSKYEENMSFEKRE